VTRPGERLRQALARWCSDKTLRQRIDPAIADIQCEHRQALQQGRRWHARWIRVASYAGLFKVLAMTAADAAVSVSDRACEEPPISDRAVLGAGLGIALAVVAVTVVLRNAPFFELVSGDVDSSRGAMLLYLVPHSLVLAVPLALLIAVGAVGPALSRRGHAAVIALAGACSVATLLNVGWIAPAANQAFRVEVAGQQIPRGDNEMTLPEARAALIRGNGGVGMSAWQVAASYYRRWAVAFAPLVLTLFALSMRNRKLSRRLLLVVPAATVLIYPFLSLVTLGIPAVLVAWLPNAVFGLLAASNYLFVARQPETAV
jgi:hypothetical protein